MTPKEKAEELVSEMCGNNCTEKNINKKKKLALIVVKDIIENVNLYSNYWQEVKQEICDL